MPPERWLTALATGALSRAQEEGQDPQPTGGMTPGARSARGIETRRQSDMTDPTAAAPVLEPVTQKFIDTLSAAAGPPLYTLSPADAVTY